MARHDHRASFHVVGGNHDLPQAIQSLDHSLKAAATLYVDDRIFGWIEKITGADHIRPAEKHDAVAVRGRRLMKDLNGFAIEIQILQWNGIRVVGPCLL